MGKRRERRKVAMASSRRVKLDIFAEPSGDSGGSPTQDELGVDIDPRHRDESPNSPSSSGKQPENPLMLLGQYSDDELDERSSQRVATPENPSAVDYEQVNGKIVTENKGKTGEGDINLNAPSDKEHVLDEYEPGQIDATGADGLVKEEVGVEETPLSDTVDVSSNVDVSTSWKVVLHEESGHYYYWNTVTGETSWVVPDVLAAGPELTGGQETVSDAGNSSSLVAVVELNPALDVGSNDSPTVLIGHNSIASDKTDELAKKDEPGSHMQEANGEQKDEKIKDSKEVCDAGQPDKCINNLMVHENNDLDTDCSSSVLRHCESLLDRFKSMEGSRNQVGGNDWISRYVLEVEIRLSDAKSLLSFGSSLLPFWVHCERKLKELEASFNAEVCQFFIDETQAVEPTHASQENEEIETECYKNDSSIAVSDIEKPYVSDYVDTSTVLKDQQNEAAYTSLLPAEHVTSMEYSTLYSDSSFEVKTGENESAQNTEAILEPMLQVEDEHEDDDMDMDVDMEVEDAKELHFRPNPPVETIHLPQKDFDVPPPPGEDWVPPPPPDSEPVPPPPPDSEPVPPPPPPDDTPEPFYPPPLTDDQTEPSYTSLPTYATVQPLSYAEQYSFTYPSSTFEYYGQTTTEFPANTTYQQTEGCHVAGTNSSVYYGSLPPSYPNAAPVLVNPVESVAYYGLQDGAVIHGSVVSGAASSGLHGDSGGIAIGSDKISSLTSQTKTNYASLSNADLSGSGVNGDTGKEYKGTSIVQTPASIANSVIQSGPMPSAGAATVASDVAKSAITNAQSKVMRSKKRSIAAAPTLRSNKKVSSLVDKWKAAKEELHNDEEDEPEDAYEILEKKRQREIEKWKKQQIASGEAKDNANFQPLGGDWRERVKRKRAQLKKEDRKSTSQDTSDVKKKPDLDDLSRDLPAGWQVYWDESSKQVYYGNTITSETTWTRPGK